MRRLLPSTFLFAAVVDAQQWTALDGPQYLDRAAAFDTHRLRLVMFSGDGETWEYDGDRLLHRPRLDGVVAPPARQYAQLAYDAQRRHVLMFGGMADGTTFADTWTFDGTRWTQLVAQTTPPGRHNGAITFDGVRGRVVMYGGSGSSVTLTDTWEQDGSQWTRRWPVTVPDPYLPVMTFDGGRAVAVMVTQPGWGANQPVRTWEWNGMNWLLRAPATVVPTMSGPKALAFDPVRQCTVMTGGEFGGDQVWEWDGTMWTQRATVPAPHRNYAASWFDPIAGKVVLAGGRDVWVAANFSSQGSWRSDAYEWDGVAMAPRRSDHRPPSRIGHTWFVDPVRREIFLFGGMFTPFLGTTFADTWRWNSNAWTRLAPANQPSGRFAAAATYDWLRGEALLFGGAALGQTLGDLWAWTGTDWAPRGSGVGPPPRANPGFCFDLLRGVAVLFGGGGGYQFAPTSLRDDTWEWNGAVWTPRPTTVQPSPRFGPAMAFDVARGRTVLFGGAGGSTVGDHLGDTWEWDGTQWLAIQPLGLPSVLRQPSLSYDFLRSRAILSGTRAVGTLPPVSYELWSYNGVTWTSIGTSSVPAVTGPCAFDAGHDRLVNASGAVLSEWSLRPSSVAEYGSGCGSPAPELVARTRPRIGEPAFGVEFVAGAGQLAGFAFAETQASVPLGNGCTLLYGQPAASVFTLAGGNGVASVSTAIPDHGGLHGYVWFAQAGVLDPASPGGFRLTQGLRIAFGD